MACGCGSRPRPDPAVTGPDPSLLLSAAMCGACCSLDRPGMVVCTIDGKPSLSRPCPIGKHDRDGKIEWMGLEWYGMPYPIRWAYRREWFRRLLGLKNPRLANLPANGCGCYVGLKDAVLRFRG